MRRVVCLLAACSSGSPAQDPPTPPAPVAPRVIAPITGAHGGEINALAVTADGLAAVTGDTTGGVRLWPTLDGSREPVVVKAPAAAALAIAHDGAGFAIAVTDDADHVELVRLDGKGLVRSRRQLGAAQQVEIVGDTILALRADQVIDHVAFDGTLLGQLAPEAGTRIDALVASGEHVVAMLAGSSDRHARRIDVGAIAWGATSATLPFADDAVATLAPDGASLAAVARDGRIHRVDFATGAPKLACPAAMPNRHGFDEFGARGSRTVDAAVGFIGDRVGCFVDGAFSWFDIEKGTTVTTSLRGSSPSLLIAAADRIIVASNHQLALATPERTDYLGYGFRDLTHVRSVPTGLLIGKGDQEPVLLDERFRERARFALPRLRVDWTDLVPIDDRYVIASSTRSGTTDLWGSTYQIAIYDTVKQVMHQVLPHRARTGELTYDPATKLLVATDAARTLLVRLDPQARSLGGEVLLDLPDTPKQVVLLDPKLSGGVVALAIRDEGGGGLVISELHAADLPPMRELDGKPRPAVKPRATYRIAGELRGVDRAGRVYVHDVMHAESVGIYVHGTWVSQLIGAQAARLRPSPDGRHVVAVDNGRLSLFAADGTRRWEVAAWGSSDVDWTASGSLYARFPHALARIEVDTGALAERQCGWSFGISANARESSSTSPSVCDVAP